MYSYIIYIYHIHISNLKENLENFKSILILNQFKKYLLKNLNKRHNKDKDTQIYYIIVF